MGPGTSVTSRFGHAALCVKSKRYPQGQCFNYGASPARAGLWRDIVLGRAMFMVKPQSYASLMTVYMKAGRSVYAQPIVLDAQALELLVQRLEHESLPAHREYLYNPFTQNCSTRLRDLIDEASGGALRAASKPGTSTYREVAAQALRDEAPLMLGMELTVGRAGDAPLSDWDAMFAPAELRRIVASSMNAPIRTLYQGQEPTMLANPARRLHLYLVFFGAAMGLSVLFLCRYSRLTCLVALSTLGLSLASLSAVPIAATFASALPQRWPHEALLVAWPTDLLIPWLAWRRHALLQTYLRLRLLAGLLCAIGLLLGLLVQPLWPLLCLVMPALFAATRTQPLRLP